MIGKALGKVFETSSDLLLGTLNSKPVQGALRGVFKGISKSIDPAAGVANKALQGATAGISAATKKETYQKIGKAVENGAGYVTKNVLTDPDSYKQIGKTNILASNKALFADDLQRRVTTGLSTIASAATYKSKMGNKIADKLEVDHKLLNIPSRLVRGVSNGLVTSGGDNLLPFGVKATGLGVVAATAFQVGSGAPEAVKSWNNNRQGYNYDNQPVTSAPRVPAYAQNAGATGDLVFALNNLRHGGMM